MQEVLCAVCGKKAENLCGKCQAVRYCSKEHQRQDWKTHKNRCFPCRIEENSVIGRHLIATRKIKAGEVIITDPPLVVGPQTITKPVCLGCNDAVDGKYACEGCGFPLCGPQCPSPVNHRRECDTIRAGGQRVKIGVSGMGNPMYRCVTPLRCLWMKSHARDKWDALMGMEAHLKERRASGRVEEIQNFIVNVIRKYLKLERFSEDEIQKVCGVLETNGFEVPELNMVGLFGFGYLLEHSCLANTTRTLDARLNLVVTAAVDIQSGDHITTCYVNPIWGERIRKLNLMKFKYFECSCPRCVDPSDLNTHLSSIRCKACCKGVAPPPRDITSPWICNECDSSLDACQVEEALVSIYKQTESISPPSVQAFEKFLKDTSRSLSENHQYRVEAKMALLQMYGKPQQQQQQQQRSRNKIPVDEIVKKREFCRDVLAVANVVAPGLSRIRGITLYELGGTFLQHFASTHKKFRKTEEGQSLLQEAEEDLSEAVMILKLETHLKEERTMAEDGEKQLNVIRSWKSSQNK